MDILNEINKEISKERVSQIAAYIEADQQQFATLMNIFLKGLYVTTQRAGWVLSECAIKNPNLVIPYFRNFIQKLQEPFAPDSVKRNIVRIWQFIDIPEEYEGDIYNICFGYLHSNEAIAVQVFSMTVCHHITRNIPELKTELRLAIEDIVMKNQDGSAAIKSRAKKILADLKKNK